ncbi:PaaI family thioesterase [Bacillus horti]|uniref:Uncharacterized protein (TIGR00369 family) n=1 Tax=Caldalkalibacillus horti TaxID=77523 RepID=A0ABT9W0A7_9BACI|nr:PaaI family thioesterase [Bacillus horti]MDQ0166693.1 uncharacterized protein (TIGR00369 family) [Bacillus horti]
MEEVSPYTVQDLLDVVHGDKHPPNCDLTMKVKAYFAKDGLAKGIWTVHPEFLNGHGVAMGGFVSAAADIMMAYAMASKLGEKQGFSSITLQATYHRPIALGTVEIEARVERLGKSVAYVEATLSQNNKRAATLTSSIMVVN